MCRAEFYRGYFVCDTEVINNYERTKALVIKTERPYNAYYRYIDYKPYRLTDPSNISKSIYFHRQEIDKLFNQATDLNAQLASLQADNDRLTAENQQQADTIQQLNERLMEQAGELAEPIADNSNSRSQDDKLIVAMALLLAEKNNKFTRANKPNATQIGIAINGIADYLLEYEEKYGLTASDQRIRKALNNTAELIKK